ncbi:alternate-type signal peptide domain-containing protein [Gordonia humi]|uniref:Alternate signal-mediated exported protein n=1 Tax=Gordonia humi TaxID=686429 RepID=A0A840F3Z2_9ACTN|nr:alternate-type signal peptide domain-containing protein [Gordonia humi]MBB4137178.1 alternate signal-mediated exported protein [Gordonia humi]
MNRRTKGALAIGAGVIILLGGAGSYALWSDTEDIAGGNIQTGDFGLDCGTGEWTDESATTNGGTAINPTSDLMVPGDVWQYAGTCLVTATGKNIDATLGVEGIGGDDLPSSNFAVTTTVDGTDTTTTPISVADGDSLPVTVTLEFKDTTTGTEDTDVPVDVSGMKVTLRQVRPA